MRILRKQNGQSKNGTAIVRARSGFARAGCYEDGFFQYLHYLFLGALFAFALFTLTGCLPESAQGPGEGRLSQSRVEAQNYAAALAQHALQVQDLVTRSDVWKSGAVSQGDFAQMDGVDLSSLTGPSASFIRTGFCEVNEGGEDTQAFLSWFETAGGTSDGGSFALKGLGKNAGPQIVAALADEMSPETIGLHDNGVIRLSGARVAGDLSVEISGSCGVSIADGAPVLIFSNITPPTPDAAHSVELTETQTQSCQGGGLGSIVRQRSVSFNPVNGETTPSGDWEVVEDSCGTNLAGSFASEIDEAQQGSSVTESTLASLNTLELTGALNDLRGVPCRSASDSSGDDEDQENDGLNLTTCDTQDLDFSNLEGVQDATLGDVTAPLTITRNCGVGTLNSFTGSFDGKTGAATPLAGWSGQVKYRRNVQVGTIAVSGSNQEAQQRNGGWFGEEISCTRPERLVISCDNLFPGYSGNPQYTPGSNTGAVFTRTNTVSGWVNPASLVPNASLGSDQGWNLQSVDCKWEQPGADSFLNCPDGFFDGTEVEFNGFTLNSIISQSETPGSLTTTSVIATGHNTLETTTTGTTQPSVCKKTEVSSGACTMPAGVEALDPLTFTPIITAGNEEGLMTLEIKTAATAYSPEEDPTIEQTTSVLVECFIPMSFDCCVCLGPDSPVEMADGSVRPIANIREGDMTKSGRVLKATKTPWDDASKEKARGGLYEYEGILVTGNHVVYEGEGKSGPSFASNAAGSRLADDQDTLKYVYNLVTEEGTIPVKSQSEGARKTILFADYERSQILEWILDGGNKISMKNPQSLPVSQKLQ